MSDRDRLIELFKGAESKVIEELNKILELEEKEWMGIYADYLLDNGVIVPPCKVGDTVYAVGDIDGHQIKACQVNFFDFESAEHFEANVYFDCDDNCDGCYFNAWSQSYCGEWDCDNAYGRSCIPISDFGKTVFLTKEEAEQKLKEHEGK